MAVVEVECSECGASLSLDESLMGSTTTCPGCKLPFVVERAGAYDLADEPRRRPGRSPTAGGPADRPEPPETEEQRRIRERMERWAGDA